MHYRSKHNSRYQTLRLINLVNNDDASQAQALMPDPLKHTCFTRSSMPGDRGVWGTVRFMTVASPPTQHMPEKNVFLEKKRMLELARQRREKLVQAGLSLLRDPEYLAARAQLAEEATRPLRKCGVHEKGEG